MTSFDFNRARFNMVEQQLRPWEVLQPQVVAALHASRRELFVPTAHVALAYVDAAIPLPHGASLLPPKLEAHALQALQMRAGERVLEVGSGSGYMAALLASLSGHVSTVEIVPELVELAKENLRRATINNVSVHLGDGLAGLPGDAPFDAIMVSGSLAVLPQALLEQLKVGGRLFAIIGEAPAMRATRVTRVGTDAWRTEALFETQAPRLVEPACVRFAF